MSLPGYKAVSKRRRCPICGSDGWCLIANDGATVLCPRTPHGAVKRRGDAGFEHVIDQHAYDNKIKSQIPEKPAPPPVITDWEPNVSTYERNITREHLTELAIKLRVRAASLAGLRIGFAFQFNAFTFPMYDAAGKIVGIRLRNIRGDKWSVAGSRNGLFIPTFTPDFIERTEEWWVVEGPTDLAAMLDLQLPTIGRPGCNIGVIATCQFLKGKRVNIVSNFDEVKTRKDGSTFFPGQEGSAVLADCLLSSAKEVRVMYPRKGKDVREWRRHGATTAEVLMVRDNVPLWARKGAA